MSKYNSVLNDSQLLDNFPSMQSISSSESGILFSGMIFRKRINSLTFGKNVDDKFT